MKATIFSSSHASVCTMHIAQDAIWGPRGVATVAGTWTGAPPGPVRFSAHPYPTSKQAARPKNAGSRPPPRVTQTRAAGVPRARTLLSAWMRRVFLSA